MKKKYKPIPPIPETKKTPENIETILRLIADGMTNIEACKAIGIHPATWYEWLANDNSLADKYARNKDISDDIRAERVVDNTRKRADQRVDPATNRLLYDAEKWHISKISPKKYGDKQSLEVEGKQEITVRVLSAVEIEKKEGNNV
jgi:hypothetical protein